MRYFIINQNVLDDLVAYSREIVKKRGYPVEELVYGLQNKHELIKKIEAEYEALRRSENENELYSNAANLGRYSALLDVVAPDERNPHRHYIDALSACYTYGLNQEEIEITMSVKYGMRQALPYPENETPEQRSLRKVAEIAACQAARDVVRNLRKSGEKKWSGWPLAEVAEDEGIKPSVLYNHLSRKDLPFVRKAGKTTLINKDHPDWQRWLRRYRTNEERVIPASEWPDPSQDERVFS